KYAKMAQQSSPNSPILKNCFNAFWVGGGICTFGQVLCNIYQRMGASLINARAWVSVTIIVITAVLTALHLFGKIARFAGAGTLVPISGFANSVASPAIEFKSEGQVLGLGAKIFSIAGPVILYGIAASAVYGLIYWIAKGGLI
ncbi:MAG: SpoVA/SpoVAEb family sporulation membrane protein, partial [Clostridia bacterium]|nr:SpoVA/SpoVAEb family sporulation membrane protein [Clostridia bacterium]